MVQEYVRESVWSVQSARLATQESVTNDLSEAFIRRKGVIQEGSNKVACCGRLICAIHYEKEISNMFID